MATIAGRTMTVMKGRPAKAAAATEAISARPGEDYNRFRSLGLRAADRWIRTLEVAADAAAADALEATYNGLLGTAVTIVDGHGVTHTNVVLIAVHVRLAPAIVDGAAKYLVWADWTVKAAHPPA